MVDWRDADPAAVLKGAETIDLQEEGSDGVLLLHGFGDTPQTLSLLASRLHKCGYGVLVPLLPGHGRTMEAFTRSRADEWIDAARNSLLEMRDRSKAVSVVGLSMGGALAVLLAAEFRRNPLALGRIGRRTKREESPLDSRSYRAREKPCLWRSDGKGTLRAVESDESREEGSSRSDCSDFSGAVAGRPAHFPSRCGIRLQRARSEGEKTRLDRRRGTHHHGRLWPRARIQRSREVAAGTRQPWDDSRRRIAERLSSVSKLEAILYEFSDRVDRSLAQVCSLVNDPGGNTFHASHSCL